MMLFSLLLFAVASTAQEHDHDPGPAAADSGHLRDCLLKASWMAHTRSFFMSTVNEGPLKDDYALASGAGIGVLTKPFHGFQAGTSGFFIYNLLSSDLAAADAHTNAHNRYEAGLFDVQDLSNRKDLDRLEELFIRYAGSRLRVTAGKMKLQTPFINAQDSRMRPTLVEGLWLSVQATESLLLDAGLITAISPRSTVRWFSLTESMGVYSQGVNVDGTKSEYAGNLSGSEGMLIGHISCRRLKNISIDTWNGLVPDIMNTAMLEVKSFQENGHGRFYQGILLIHQDALGNGGHPDPQKTYLPRGARSNVVSVQGGWKMRRFNTSLNYTHITGDGRYLMPREWGKEIFYTVMQRERVEGLGRVHAFMLRSVYSQGERFSASVAYGYSLLPDVHDYRLNKYGMPSYQQLNLSASCALGGYLQGMHLRILAAYKFSNAETYEDPRYIYNKVNLLNLNLIIDFSI